MFNLRTWPRSAWSIFDELDSLQDDVNRLFSERSMDSSGRQGRVWRRRPSYPLMNVWSSSDGIVIDAELPGVDAKDVDISVVGDQLTLCGKLNLADSADGEFRVRRERPSGEFSRTLQLPFRADADSVKAHYRNGILRLTIPRLEDEKPRKIQIES